MFEALAEALAAGLTLWKDKNATKYVDKLMRLRREYREESNKPEGVRSDAVLDNLTFELRNLGVAFSAGVAATNATVQPDKS